MKAEELMIGDYINYRGQIIKVTSLYDKGGSNEVGWSDKERVWVNADNVEPIPLTAEILEKNLATEPQIAWCLGWNKKDDIHVEIKREGLNAAFYGVIDFVHQLQQALRLCRINKEIVL